MNAVTKKMIEAYYQQSQVQLGFFSGMFQAPQGNFYAGEKVEIDIVRSGEDVAVAVQDLTTGYRYNSLDEFTNKEFKAPIFKEAVPINASDLMKREPGQNPYQDPSFRANLISKAFRGFTHVERKIARSCELQASQIMQTGVVTLKDTAGASIYTLDFKAKTTHIVNAGTAWDQAGADPLGDLAALADVIRTDGQINPDRLVFGSAALRSFLGNSAVQKVFDIRNINLGSIGPAAIRGNGGTFHGTVSIGAYNFEVWSYQGVYKDPADGVTKPFMDTKKVVMSSSAARLDATFGAIPNIGEILGTSQRALILPELPARMSSSAVNMDLFTTAWTTNDGEQLFIGAASRPLYIPTAIDSFGCLSTGLA